MRRFAFIPALLALALAWAAPASAATETLTFRYGPITVDGYEVKQNDFNFDAPTPQRDGFITSMSVDIVDADGTAVPINRLMLHHIVFANMGSRLGEKRDATCNSFEALDSKTQIPGLAERFYAAGEERAKLVLPPGHGYPVKKNDSWALFWMLMNHRQKKDTAFIEYTVTIDDDPSLTPVEPWWLDVRNCKTDPVFDVPGGQRRGSTFALSTDFVAPRNGRVVAGAGHVHGGGRALFVTQPDCGDRRIHASKPTWGNPDHPFYTVKPILHEPGPIHMSGFGTAEGWPVAAGQRLRLTAAYDGHRVHTRAMGIEIVYFAPDETATDCGEAPSDVVEDVGALPGRLAPPAFTVPLTGINSRGRAVTIKAPPGRRRVLKRGAKVTARDFAIVPANIEVPVGSRVTWRFPDRTLHNITIANGPVGFSSPHLNDGRTYSKKLTKPGTYQIFCSLHPVTMTETVKVVPRKKKRR